MVKKQLFLSIATLFIFIVISGGIVSAVGTYPDVDENMVLYYHFNNQSEFGENDTHVYDFSGKGNNGTVIGGAVWNSSGGYLGDGAFEFDGVNDYIHVSDSEELSPWNNGNVSTFSMWIKTNVDESSDGGNGQYIFAKGSGGNYEYQLTRTNSTYDKKIVFTTYNLGATVTKPITLKQGYSDNVWYKIDLVLDGTKTNAYLNGVYVGQTDIALSGNGATNLLVGQRTSAGFFNGTIDDFVIYNRTLSPEEIWQNYQNYQDGACLSSLNLGQTLVYNTTLCPGLSINLNSTGSANALVVGSNDLTLDCQGSRIHGNYTSTGTTNRGIFNGQYINTIIKNCTFEDYYLGIYTRNTKNQYYSNINFINSFGLDFDNVSDSYMINSTSFNGTIFSGEESFGRNNNLTFDNLNCTFSNITRNTGNSECFGNIGNNGILKNSYFYDFNRITAKGENNTYENLYLHNSYDIYGRGIVITGTYPSALTTNNLTFRNIYIENVDMGIAIQNVSNVLFDNLTIYNATKNTDYYDVGFHNPYSSINVTIQNSKFLNFGSTGILLRQANDFILNNITCYNTLDILNGHYDCTGASCQSEPVTCIFIEQSYKGFMPIGWVGGANITGARQHTSYNINIKNINSTNIPVKLKNQGGINITFDNSITDNTWYKRFGIPTWSDPEEFYIDNSFEYPYTILNNEYYPYLFSGPTYHPVINYTFKKNQYEYYQNIYDYNLAQLNYDNITQLFNKSSALIYNTNGSIYGSSNIQDNDGNINITLPPNNASYVLDNFNLTEGITRENSPLWISSQSSDRDTAVYHLASNLTDSIDGVKFYPDNVKCGSASYVSDTGTVYESLDVVCSDDGLIEYIIINDYEPANNSNILTITYTNLAISNICSEGTLSLSDSVTLVGIMLTILFVGGVISILILSFNGYINTSFSPQNLDLDSILKGVMIIGLTFLFLLTFVYIFSHAYCGAIT